MKKIFISTFLLFLFATAFLGISAITSGEFDETSARILITTAAASFYSLIGLTCVVQLGKRGDILGKVGLAFCAVALAHAIYTTWTLQNGDLGIFQHRIAFVIAGTAIAHACLMMLIVPRSAAVSGLVVLAIGAVALNTLVAIGMVYSFSSGAVTALGVLAIIGTCATIAAPALNFASAKPEA